MVIITTNQQASTSPELHNRPDRRAPGAPRGYRRPRSARPSADHPAAELHRRPIRAPPSRTRPDRRAPGEPPRPPPASLPGRAPGTAHRSRRPRSPRPSADHTGRWAAPPPDPRAGLAHPPRPPSTWSTTRTPPASLPGRAPDTAHRSRRPRSARPSADHARRRAAPPSDPRAALAHPTRPPSTWRTTPTTTGLATRASTRHRPPQPPAPIPSPLC